MSSKPDRFAELQDARAASLAARLDRLLSLDGSERVLDVGTGTGALAFALAPRAHVVVGLDSDAAMAARARERAPANVEIVVGDGERLPFDDASFDCAATLRTLHHTAHPDRLVSELARVTRTGGIVLVADQLGPADRDAADALDRFEQARDASTTHVLSEIELRALLAAVGLTVRREELAREPRELERYLDLAGCEGAARDRARALAPPGYEAPVGFFVSARA